MLTTALVIPSGTKRPPVVATVTYVNCNFLDKQKQAVLFALSVISETIIIFKTIL